jgi:hypothetical protein
MPDFFGVSFLMPAFLGLLPAVIAGLFYAYRRGGKGREIIVSTVFILRELAGVPKSRQKFWPPPRFFLELLCLLALVLAAAGVSSKKFEDKFVILIDNSLSMAARVGSVGNSTLIELAKRDALSFLMGLSGDKGVKICVTSPILNCLSDTYVSLGSAQESLENVSVAFGEDKIDEGVNSILLDPSEPQIVVFSDKSLAESSKPHPKVSVRSTAELSAELQNIAILGGQIDAGKAAGTVKLVVDVAAFADAKNQVDLRIESIEQIGGSYATNILSERSLVLSDGETAAVAFEVPKASAYKVSLALRQSLPANSIAEDDVAYFVPDLSSGKVLLVSDFSVKQLGLSKVSTLSFESSSLAEYRDNLEGVDFVIFHKVVPDGLPKVNSLFVSPETSAEFFSLKPSRRNTEKVIEVTSWDEINSITSYLKMPILKFSEVTPLLPQAGASIVVTSNAGPIVLSLEKNEARYVATGFEIFPYAAGKTPALSILSLNIFKWLSGRGISVGFSDLPLVVGKQFLKVSDVLARNDFAPGTLVANPGVYMGEYRDTRAAQLLAFNFFSENESDKSTRQTFVLPSGDTQVVEVGDSASSFAPLIILTICTLVSFDLMLQVVSLIRRRYYRV